MALSSDIVIIGFGQLPNDGSLVESLPFTPLRRLKIPAPGTKAANKKTTRETSSGGPADIGGRYATGHLFPQSPETLRPMVSHGLL